MKLSDDFIKQFDKALAALKEVAKQVAEKFKEYFIDPKDVMLIEKMFVPVRPPKIPPKKIGKISSACVKSDKIYRIRNCC